MCASNILCFTPDAFGMVLVHDKTSSKDFSRCQDIGKAFYRTCAPIETVQPILSICERMYPSVTCGSVVTITDIESGLQDLNLTRFKVHKDAVYVHEIEAKTIGGRTKHG